ncbi:MAG: barstar family protein, partial [Pseudomonadota bacterium]
MSDELVVEFDGVDLVTWEAFHQTFSERFGFFDGYGRNMNAWIDCLGYMRIATSEQRLSDFHVPTGKTMTIKLTSIERLKKDAPDILTELFECAAIVNRREVEAGEAP